MSYQQIKALTEQRGQTLADMKAMLTKAETEKRDLTAEESKTFDDLSAKAEGFAAQIKHYQQLADGEKASAELRAKAEGQGEQKPGREDTGTPKQRDAAKATEYREAVDAYIRHGEKRAALSVTGMGVVGDRPIYNQLVIALKSFAGVREAGALIVPTTEGNDLVVPTMDDTSNTGQIVGEATTDNTEVEPTGGNVTLHAYKFDSKWIKISLEMLQDAAFPAESYILGVAGERIGRAFNTYATTGSGTAQPKGVVPAAGVAVTAASASAFTYEELLNLVYSVDAAYRNSPAFRLMFTDLTLAAIRKLKDGSGRYIFNGNNGVVNVTASVNGGPTINTGTILDYRYVVNNSMAELGAAAKCVVAGDFSRYFCRDVAAPYLVRADELFIGDGLIGFRIFSRHDGNVTDTRAFKVLQLAAS